MLKPRSIVFAATFLTGCSADPQGPGTVTVADELLGLNQISGNALSAKTIVFTYDDGPDEHTLELAHYLADNGIHATFFINGRRICKTTDAAGTCTAPMDTRPCDDGKEQVAVASPKYYPESLLDEVLSLGHRIGNHTQDHCHLAAETNAADLAWEVKATQDILDRHICDGVFLFRPPFGDWDSATLNRLNASMGFNKLIGPIGWDVDGGDWSCWVQNISPDACATKYLQILMARPNQNGVFLMHDRPEFTVGYEGPLLITKILVPKLKADGFEFATFDQVLKLSPKDGGSGCPAIPPGPDAAARDVGGATDTPGPADANVGGGGPDTSLGGSDDASSPGTGGSRGSGSGGAGGAAGSGGNGGSPGRADAGQDPGGEGGNGPPAPTGGASNGCQCALARPGTSGPGGLVAALAALGLCVRRNIRRRPPPERPRVWPRPA